MLMFSYGSPKKIPNPNEFLDETAKKFIELLFAERKKGDNKVPIVFLAHGFGCLVLQRAIGLLAEDSARLSEDSIQTLHQTAGIIFVDALFPAAGAESSEPATIVPQGPNSGLTVPLKDWVEKKSIDAGGIWKNFYGRVNGSIPIVWFYSQGEKKGSAIAKVLIQLPILYHEDVDLTINRNRFRSPGYSSKRLRRRARQSRVNPQVSATLSTKTSWIG
jgi:hypothetical protein